VILFASTIALSAFLLFLVQPLIAKQILPWFGGGSAVWTTCLVFFQCVLLAGYLYADTLIRRVQVRTQAWVHIALLAASLAVLPIVPSEAMKPVEGTEPTLRIVALLALTIGLPYLMLSTTGPLVQAWFSRRYEGQRVYRLYALSNAASMAALLLYPPVFEPAAPVQLQATVWSGAYAVFALLAGACAWWASRAPAASGVASPPQEDGPPSGVDPHAQRVAAPAQAPGAFRSESPPRARDLALWLVLSALGSVLLLAITTHLTQNVASVPFLWVLPLSLYLLTFILCFDSEGWYRPRWMAPAAAVAALLMVTGLVWHPTWSDERPWLGVERGLMEVTHAVPLYALGLFLVCMFCHGELAARKPAPQHLTRFFLMVSVGGAVGGLLVGVVAPLVYDWTWELPQALVLTPALVLALALMGRAPVRALVGLLCLAGAVAVFIEYRHGVREDAIVVSRNFYGTLRVQTVGAEGDSEARLRLLHGTILHGEQFLADSRRREPTTYYGESSGVGRALMALREASGGAAQRVGLIGLGVGTLATYGREGDHVRIYEINPSVIELARKRFTYLSQSPAQIVTPLGDARLVLEREPPQRLDLLAVDAFSSDSIPVHLVTREAMAVYRRHVRDDGAIAFHISNRYLELSGVVRQLADSVGWTALSVVDDPPSSSPLFRTTWVVVTANAPLLQALRAAGAQDIPAPTIRPWTDSRNNLFDVLK
jgi:hypothetical protein